MNNIFIIDSFLCFLKKAQRNKQILIHYKSTKQINNLVHLFLKFGLISGYTLKNTNFTIYLKYNYTKPVITDYKIFSKPSKKIFINKKKIQIINNSPQSFFFFINHLGVISLSKNFNKILPKFVFLFFRIN